VSYLIDGEINSVAQSASQLYKTECLSFIATQSSRAYFWRGILHPSEYPMRVAMLKTAI